MTKILVVEDEPDIAGALRLLFERAGYEFAGAAEGRTGLRMVHEVRPDLVVLDIGLPGMDGWAVLERIRDIADVPVLLLTARGQEMDKVRGLRAGADDYLTKPFTNNELVARIEALLRRSRRPAVDSRQWADCYDDGVIRVDLRSRLVTVDEREVELTNTEFRLLNVLVRHAGAVLSPTQLLASVWDDPTGVGPERVKFAVLRLRRKLGWASDGAPITAVRGVGYRYQSRNQA
ncbi:MAG TPA: response regulator transcription factor [Pseudonocardiaceae bacterium]|nr:response regulator transcription factor [Pseudonocardiaceae bacterium]